MSTPTVAKRLNVNLSDEVAKSLETMAEQEGLTITEVVRRSISTEAFLRQAIARGEKILLMEPDTQRLREVVFR